MSKLRQITITRPVTVEVSVAVPSSDAPALSREACVDALVGGVEMGVMPPWIEVQSEERTLEPGAVLDAELLPVAEPFPGESTFLVGDRVMVVPDDAWRSGRKTDVSVVEPDNPLRDVADSLRRLADAHAPPPKEKVGSPYVAEQLGVTTIYVAEMARDGAIPKSCLVPGTGNGKVWKFYREQIDKWIASR